MTSALDEVAEKLTRAEQALDATLEEKAKAEQALSEAEKTVAEKEAALHALVSEEGKHRRVIGELRKMREAFEDASA